MANTPQNYGEDEPTDVRRPGRGRLWILRVAVLAFVLVLFASEYSNMIDRYFIFRPDRELSGDPSAVGLAFDDVRFTAADGVMLHGWFVPGADGATLVLMHGNAGNISGRLRRLAELHGALGMNVFIFDYRGYGLSEGRASEKGTYLDAEAALDYVVSRGDVDPDRIVLFGHSLGTAVAVGDGRPAGRPRRRARGAVHLHRRDGVAWLPVRPRYRQDTADEVRLALQGREHWSSAHGHPRGP